MRLHNVTGLWLRVSCLVAAVACSAAAPAAIILPGQHDVPIRERTFDNIAVIDAARSFAFDTALGHVEGQITDAVRDVDGKYAFITRVLLTQAPAGFSINQVLRTDYAGFLTDARPQPDLGGLERPRTAGRSDAPGSSVEFNFLPGEEITLAESSSYFAILTDATEYTEGQLRLRAGNELLGPITVFSPFRSVVPEPQQWILLIAGAVLMAMRVYAAFKRPARLAARGSPARRWSA
jgi:hypothetical protein